MFFRFITEASEGCFFPKGQASIAACPTRLLQFLLPNQY